jgi:hypothetical protein
MLENSRPACRQQVRPRKDLLSHEPDACLDQQGQVGDRLIDQDIWASIKLLARSRALARTSDKGDVRLCRSWR